MSSVESLRTLEELLEVDGVVAAGEFAPDGSLVDYETNMEMPDEFAAMSAQFCASVTMFFDTLGGAFNEIIGLEWAPQQGWAYSGCQSTVAVGGIRGVFTETEKADYNALFAAFIDSK